MRVAKIIATHCTTVNILSKLTGHLSVYTEQPGYCTAHLINEGMSIKGREVIVEFSPTGDAQETFCILDPPKTEENNFFPC